MGFFQGFRVQVQNSNIVEQLCETSSLFRWLQPLKLSCNLERY